MKLDEAKRKVAWACQHVRATFQAEVDPEFVEAQEVDFPIRFRKGGRVYTPTGIRQSWVGRCDPDKDYIHPGLALALRQVDDYFKSPSN